uniref:Leucine-rich repeat-containing N-terminal plant-type domain-containing protein n=1 Tax=Setaria italica TaxID=4555 RepID=K3XNC5_SETIT
MRRVVTVGSPSATARKAASLPSSHREPLLLYLLLLSLGAAQSRSNLPPCEPEQALALLRLKATFPVTNHSASPACALGSWPAGADCCRWDGVRCGYVVPRYTTGTVARWSSST